jgi:uncharacterized protein
VLHLSSTAPLLSYTLSSLAMIMVTVGTFIAGRYVFRDGFANAGWHWGKPKHYGAVFGLAILIWVVPIVLELALGMRRLPVGVLVPPILAAFLLRFVATLLPGFGEEFGWRGYLLPHLAQRYSPRRAVLLHSFIWWAWHLPVAVSIGMITAGSAGAVGVTIAIVLLVSLVSTMMNGVIYAYLWSSTQSLAVVTVYHSAYDEMRDALETSVGFGPLASPWDMIVNTLLGAVLLWKGNWKQLTRYRSAHEEPQA